MADGPYGPYEPPERYEVRKSLMILNWDLDADESQHRFDSELLEKHNIHVEHMSLDEGSAHNPRFFAPRANLPPVTAEILEAAEKDMPKFFTDSKSHCARWFYLKWHDYVQNMIFPDRAVENWVNACGRLWHKLLCKGLPNNPNSEASSQPMEVWRSDDRYLPHVKATILVNTSVKSGEFLRAEILSVLRLIIHQMRQKRLSPHMIVPALVVSIVGERARLIEAFCEDGKIVLRATKLYDFPKDMPIASQDFARWYESTPTGDTRWYEDTPTGETTS